MNEHQTLVREFHSRFGLTINDSATLSPADDILRVNLIHEEAMELWEAERTGDRVAIADALGDLAYVIYGAGVTYGVEVFPMGGFSTREAHELLAGNAAFAQSLCGDDILQVETELRYLMSDVHHLAHFYSIPLDPVFREIHRSNMSKLWTEKEFRAACFTGDAAGRPNFTEVSKTDERCMLAKRRGDGKVIKSPPYSPVDLAPIPKTSNPPAGL